MENVTNIENFEDIITSLGPFVCQLPTASAKTLGEETWHVSHFPFALNFILRFWKELLTYPLKEQESEELVVTYDL